MYSSEETPSGSHVSANDPSPDTIRKGLGVWGWLAVPLGTALTLFQLYTALYGNYVSLIQGAVHVGGAMGLIFLLYPAKKSLVARPTVAWYDAALACMALGTNFYIVVNYERLVTDAVVLGYTDLDHVTAALGILLVLEGTRRCVGLPIVLIAALALFYGVFGEYVPFLGHPGLSWDRMAAETYFSTTSIFGTPIQVSATYIYLFLFFGVILIETNIGKFFSDVAFAATGRRQGGTAKAAVVASALQGMVSGSSVSNTVASGSFTIPMMKRAGFRPAFAGAVEAAASTGGQIMPPVMGAAAFIMAAFTGIPYSDIIVIAAIPAFLYFAGVFAAIHFQAGRRGILGLTKAELPSSAKLLKRSHLFLPLIVIVVTLLSGRTASYAALLGIGVAFAVSLLQPDTRMSLSKTIQILNRGAQVALPVIAACATAGIVAGTVTKTGVGGKLAGGILEFAGGSMLLVLLFTMISCLVLGMGLPTTANYVVTATIAAPILVANFDIPLISAHLFVFYFGILADITPPVCLAAYAGAGVANANPMKTGATAFKLAIAGFITPFVFVVAPALVLEGESAWLFMLVFSTTCLGIIAVSAGIMGHFLAHVGGFQRGVLLLAGIMLVWPQVVVSSFGFLVFITLGALQYRHSRPGDQGESALSSRSG